MSCCGGPRSAPDFDQDVEGLSEADLARFGGDEVPCPSCGVEVYADVPMCPRCGVALTGDDPAASPARGAVTVVMVGAIVMLTALGIALF